MTRTYRHLCAEERGVIMAMRLHGDGVCAIAKALNRSSGTISRELKRLYSAEQLAAAKGRRIKPSSPYDALKSGEHARRKRFKRRRLRKLHADGDLWKCVKFLLRNAWSPEQISLRLKRLNPGQIRLQASHETIYTAIYALPVGGLRKDLVDSLRRHHHVRRSRNRKGEPRGPGRGVMADMVSIHDRPPEASDRTMPGHWEGDLIIGANNASRVGTLVCRKTMFVMLVKINGNTALDTLQAYEKAFSPLHESLRQTLTYDQGKEMALHKRLSASQGLKIYFADPKSPWQRGTNENTNGLIRQYLPKGIDLSVFSQDDLDRIAWSLNTRPRKSLGAQMPIEVLIKDCFDRDVAYSHLVALGP